MKRMILLAAAVCGLNASGASAQAVPAYTDLDPGGGGTSMLQGQAINGSAPDTTTGTKLLLDDLHLATGAGININRVDFAVQNTDSSSAFTARLRIRFFADDGAGGGPGTALLGVSFAPINFAANATSRFFFDFSQ